MSIEFHSSVAGINAFFRKMDATANNVANMNTNNYKRRVAHISQDKNGFPETKIAIDKTPGVENPRKTGEPDGPPREMSNVDYADEVLNMIEAKTGVKANVRSLQFTRETFDSLLDIFA